MSGTRQPTQEPCAGCTLCLGGAKGIVHDLLQGVDVRLAKYVKPKFKRFESELDALVVGICVASIANVALAFFVLQDFSGSSSDGESRVDRTFTSMVSLVSVSAASSDANPGSVQTILAGILSSVQFVSASNSTLSITKEQYANCSMTEFSEVPRSITQVLLLTFTALAGRLVSNVFVTYAQCATVLGLNFYLQYQNLCLVRAKSTILWDLLVNIGLIILAVIMASFSTTVKCLLGCTVHRNVAERNADPVILQEIKRTAAYRKAGVDVVTMTAVVTITSFSVFCSNVYLLIDRDSLLDTEDLSIYLTPSIAVVARSFGLMTQAYELYSLTQVLEEVESMLHWHYDEILFNPLPLSKTIEISRMIFCSVLVYRKSTSDEHSVEDKPEEAASPGESPKLKATGNHEEYDNVGADVSPGHEQAGDIGSAEAVETVPNAKNEATRPTSHSECTIGEANGTTDHASGHQVERETVEATGTTNQGNKTTQPTSQSKGTISVGNLTDQATGHQVETGTLNPDQLPDNSEGITSEGNSTDQVSVESNGKVSRAQLTDMIHNGRDLNIPPDQYFKVTYATYFELFSELRTLPNYNRHFNEVQNFKTNLYNRFTQNLLESYLGKSLSKYTGKVTRLNKLTAKMGDVRGVLPTSIMKSIRHLEKEVLHIGRLQSEYDLLKGKLGKSAALGTPIAPGPVDTADDPPIAGNKPAAVGTSIASGPVDTANKSAVADPSKIVDLSDAVEGRRSSKSLYAVAR